MENNFKTKKTPSVVIKNKETDFENLLDESQSQMDFTTDITMEMSNL